MNGIGLFPIITKPTRITCGTATLIDNIFSNYLDSIVGGILISDISDHLPIFSVIDCNYKNRIDKSKPHKRRLFSYETMGAFKNELTQRDWGEVLAENDANQAYNKFLDIFLYLYNKIIPEVSAKIHQKYQKAPWMTKGLKNSSRKKVCYIKNS